MTFEPDIEALRRAAADSDPGVIDGRAVADALESEVADAVDRLREQGVSPTVAVVRVGDDPASKIYVENKLSACEQVGIECRHVHFDASVGHDELTGALDTLSEDREVDGILLQLPLPDHLDAEACLDHIAPSKDVDGFHPTNLGGLMAGSSGLEPCAPRGIMRLLRAYDVDLAGRPATVVGRSRAVGRPMAQMLVRADATVTICHRRTRDLADEVARAELLVVATGVPELIQGDWLREGAIVVDVGITRTEGGELVGDVDADAARRRARLTTPVPGGVGPMTVATLLENTVRAAVARRPDVTLA